MAVDKTEPPIKVIITVAGLSLGILVTLRVFFVSYFNNAYETRSREHIDAMLHGGSYIWTAGRVHTEEQRRLGGLQAAMGVVAQSQRPAAIAPAPSVDTAALAGWTLAPREVPRAAPAPVPAAAAPAMDPATAAPAPAVAAAPVDLGAAGLHSVGGPMVIPPAAQVAPAAPGAH
jgi:hypothetical protein